MKKIIIPIIVITILLFYLSYMRFVPVTEIAIDGYIFTSNQLTENLLEEEPKNKQVAYQPVKVDETIYKQGNNLFVGEKKKHQINKEIPLLAKDSSRVYNLTETGQLIDHRFQKTKSYANSFLAGGTLYNQVTLEQADDNTYYFLELPSGIFINSVSFKIKSPQGVHSILENSFLVFEEQEIRYYMMKDGQLKYYKIQGIDASSEVTLGEKTFTYEDFRILLELISKPEEKDDIIDGEIDKEEKPEEPGNETEPPIVEEEVKYVKPEVSATDFIAKIYSMQTTIQINDPAARIKKNPTFEVKIKDSIYLRKSVAGSGNFELTGLLPETEYTITGSYTYLNEKDVQIKKTFFEQTIKTNDISKVEALEFTSENNSFYPHHVEITNMGLLNQSTDEVLKGLKKVTIQFDKSEYNLTSNQVLKLKKLAKIDYETPKNLTSNSTYTYQIVAEDVAGNQLVVKNNTYQAKTSKEEPTADIKIVGTDITTGTIKITVTNKDEVALSNLYYVVSNMAGEVIVKAKAQQDKNIVIENLDANEVYLVEVYADYDLQNGSGVQANQKLKETKFSTQPISTLGYIRLELKEQSLKQEEAIYRVSLNKNSTDARLAELLDEVEIKVLNMETEELVLTKRLKGAEIIKLQSGDEVALHLDGLTSKTAYQVEIMTYVRQGSKVYDLKALTNLKNFKTLKKEAQVLLINKFTTESLIDFDAKIVDLDGAIGSNRVRLEVRNTKGMLVYVDELKINDKYRRFTLNKLEKEETYTFTYTVEEYNIGYNNVTFEENKILLKDENITNVGIYGSLQLDNLLRQTTSKNVFDLSNERRWKTSGSSALFERTVNTKQQSFTLTAKNASAVYAYYLPEYKGHAVVVSFYARHTKTSNQQKVYFNGSDTGTQYLLDGLGTEWKKYDLVLGLANQYFSFNVTEISNNNTITTVEIKELQVQPVSVQDTTNKNLSYHSSGYIFKSPVMKSGIETMPDYRNDGEIAGNYGDGYARITNLKTKEVLEYPYSGKEANFVASTAGDYKIELWGAGGGDGSGKAGFNQTVGSHGGRGAYTSGTLTLKAGAKLYVYVGGAGKYGKGTSAYSGPLGGYNGGGNGGNSGSGSGGGATDIRVTNGAWNNTTSLKSRIMVAAGGGGTDDYGGTLHGTNDGSGGAGGGIYSEGAYINGVLNSEYAAFQVPTFYATKFGMGGNVTTNTDTGGGGGGYYGGAPSNNSAGGGAGGSSYISGYQGCIAIDKQVTELTDYEEYKEKAQYMSSIIASIYDSKHELMENKFYIQVIKDNQVESTKEYDMTEDFQSVNQQLNYELDRNSSYEIRLCVKVRDRLYPITSLYFSTEEEIRTIRTTNDFFAIHTNGKYLVANDLDFRSINQRLSIDFSGTIDFQGHKVLLNVQGRQSSLLHRLKANGLWKNLDVRYYFDNPSSRGSFYGLIQEQEGTIENIGITLEEATKVNNSIISLICYVNRGTIRNFVIHSKASLYGSYWLTLGCLHQYGVMENGYAYGEPIRAIYPNTNNATKRVGVLGGYSSENASVKNVFSLIGIELLSKEESTTNDRNVGNLLGEVPRTIIKNAYSYVPDNNREYNTDPNFGTMSYINAQNIYYASDHNYQSKYSNKISKLALRDEEFQNKILNSNGAFDVDTYVKYGYYPHLIWPESMPNQDYIELPAVEDDDLIDITTIDKVVQEGSKARVDLTISNPGNERITNIVIKDLDCRIISQQTQNSKTKLVIEVSNPTKYVSKYFIRSITSVGAFNIPYTRNYEDNERALDIDMYRTVSSIEEWKKMKQSLSENYMLVADLDFQNATGYQVGNLSGKFDGNGHTIRNITIESGSSLFGTITGTVKNLYVENYKKTSKTSYGGLIDYLNTNAVVDNVHMKKVNIAAATYLGGIAGYSNNATISNSSVTDYRVNNTLNAVEIQVGGLIGRIVQSVVDHCYVQEVDIELSDPDVVYAAGGLIGEVSSGTVDSVYATGAIHTDFQEAGGITGRNAGYISNAYTNVDIFSQQDLLGGIAGYSSNDKISNTLVVGNIYSYAQDTVNTHRTIGNRPALSSNYAWAEQQVNGVISGEINGDILVSTEELNQKEIYSLKVNIGNSFDSSNIGENRLPLLYNSTKTALLPNQVASKLKQVSFDLKEMTISPAVSSAVILMEIDNPHQYEITDLKIDGLKITEIRKNTNQDQRTYLEITVTPERYYDSYLLEEIVYLLDGKKEGYAKATKIDLQFYKDIEKFEDWQNISKNTFENYRLVADIDFAGKKNINTNVTFNRLEGTEGGHTIKNIDLSFTSANQALIKTVSSNISNVNFENITIKNTGSGNYTGIIRFTMGRMSDLSFKNIEIYAPNISYVACISSDRSISVRNISLEKVTTTGYHYTAGFMGRTRNYDMTYLDLKDVTVTGKGNYVAGMIGYRDYTPTSTVFHVTGDNLTVTGSGSYTGGIYGYGAADQVQVKNSHIKGVTNVGGIYGSSSGVRTIYDSSITDSIIEGSGTGIGGIMGNNDTAYRMFVSNCEIYGTKVSTSSVGGISGQGGYTINSSGIWDSKVSSLGKIVGGIKGNLSYATISNCFVRNVEVVGSYYVGGAIGQSNSVVSTIANVLVNANVTATGYAAGGVIGYVPNLNTNSAINITRIYGTIVQNTAVTAPYDVGGMIGRVDKELYPGHFYNDLVVANVTATKEKGNIGAVIGNGDAYANDINNLKVYEKTKVNDVDIKDSLTGLNTIKTMATMEQLKTQTFYTGIGMSTGTYDYTPLSANAYPILKNVANQIHIPLPVDMAMYYRRGSMTRGETPHVLPEVRVYASGIDTINIEFDKVDPRTEFTIGKKSKVVTQRVYTYGYDYQNDFEITLFDGINRQTITIKAEDIRRTVTTIAEEYYHINDGKLITNSEITEQDFVHLYQNQALKKDGNLYHLKDKVVLENRIDHLQEQPVKPLYEFRYQDHTIQTYATFSIIDQKDEVQKQIFLKNNQLEMIDATLENHKTMLVMDTYSDKNYVVTLGIDGTLSSLKHDIVYPDRFRNRKIREMSSNILPESNLLFIVYEDGDYICFDYRTGQVYAEKNDKKESLASYFRYKLDQVTTEIFTKKSTQSYETAEQLVERLEEKSIEEILTGVEKEEGTISPNYITVYEPIRQEYIVYDLNRYLESPKPSISQNSNQTLSETPILNDRIESMSKLEDYYYKGIRRKEGQLNWIVIFLGIFLLILLSLILLGTYLKRQNKLRTT